MVYGLAQEEKLVELSVARIGSQVIAKIPQGLPDLGLSSESPARTGYTFSYLVSGSNLAGVKEDSLVVTKFQMPDGKTLKRTSAYELVSSLYGKDISPDGKYAAFRVRIDDDKAIATELPMLEGTVAVYVADGTEVHTLKLSEEEKQSYTVGEYTVTISDHNAVRFQVAVGGAKKGVAGIQIVCKGQDLSSKSWGSAPGRRTWDYNYDGSLSDITVNLILWKNLREQTVSF